MGMIALKNLKLSIFSKYVNKIWFFFDNGIKSRNLFSIFKYFSKVEIDLINIFNYLWFSIKTENILSFPSKLFLIAWIKFFDDISYVLGLLN